MHTAESTEKFDFIINRRSGTVLRVGEDAIRQGLAEVYGEKAGTICFVEGGGVASSVKEWVQRSDRQGRGLIIGGGDGTVLTAAAEVLGRDDISLGVLPMGTHNLFARQLGFEADFRKAAAQYKNSSVCEVDVGQVNGLYFLCGLMIDQNSVGFYQAREDVRDKKRWTAAKKIMSTASGILFRRKKTLDVSGQEHKARVFAVTNNKLSPRAYDKNRAAVNPDKTMAVIENMFYKADQGDGLLAFYAFSGGPLQTAAMLRRAWSGTWADHKSVKVQTATEFSIKFPKSDGKEYTIVLDGEIMKTRLPLDIKIIPKGLRVYRPSRG
jgi:diacylglycerol kinase family enzyme